MLSAPLLALALTSSPAAPSGAGGTAGASSPTGGSLLAATETSKHSPTTSDPETSKHSPPTGSAKVDSPLAGATSEDSSTATVPEASKSASPASAPAASPVDATGMRAGGVVRAPTIAGALVRVEGVEFADLERALRVRLPSLALAQQGDALPAGDGLRAFVELRRTSPTQVQVALILADGRAYFRVVDTADEPPARPVAAALALLIAAIEDDSVAPDQRDVPVPPAIAEPPPQPIQSDVRKDTWVTRQCPEVRPCPRPPSPPARPPAPRLELGLVRHDGASFGLDRPLAGVRGAVFGLGLDLRWRRGAIAAVEVRATVAPVDRHTLARVRVAAGAGFGVRVRAFELPIVGLVGVEWWGLPGGEVTVARASARPLVGGGLRLSPGFWLRLPAVAVRAGARAELWASGEPGPDGPRKPLLARPGEAALAAVGGVELNLGIEVGVWFDPGRRKRTGPKGQVR